MSLLTADDSAPQPHVCSGASKDCDPLLQRTPRVLPADSGQKIFLTAEELLTHVKKKYQKNCKHDVEGYSSLTNGSRVTEESESPNDTLCASGETSVTVTNQIDAHIFKGTDFVPRHGCTVPPVCFTCECSECQNVTGKSLQSVDLSRQADNENNEDSLEEDTKIMAEWDTCELTYEENEFSRNDTNTVTCLAIAQKVRTEDVKQSSGQRQDLHENETGSLLPIQAKVKNDHEVCRKREKDSWIWKLKNYATEFKMTIMKMEMTSLKSPRTQCCCCAIGVFAAMFGIFMLSAGICIVLNVTMMEIDTSGLPPELHNENGKKVVGIILICVAIAALGLSATVSVLYFTLCHSKARPSTASTSSSGSGSLHHRRQQLQDSRSNLHMAGVQRGFVSAYPECSNSRNSLKNASQTSLRSASSSPASIDGAQLSRAMRSSRAHGTVSRGYKKRGLRPGRYRSGLESHPEEDPESVKSGLDLSFRHTSVFSQSEEANYSSCDKVEPVNDAQEEVNYIPVGPAQDVMETKFSENEQLFHEAGATGRQYYLTHSNIRPAQDCIDSNNTIHNSSYFYNNQSSGQPDEFDCAAEEELVSTETHGPTLACIIDENQGPNFILPQAPFTSPMSSVHQHRIVMVKPLPPLASVSSQHALPSSVHGVSGQLQAQAGNEQEVTDPALQGHVNSAFTYDGADPSQTDMKKQAWSSENLEDSAGQ